MKKKFDAAVAGHICLDIIPLIQSHKSQDINSIFIPGRLINLNGVKMSGGGAVANTGGAMNKLGLDILPIASTGNDEFGQILMGTVKKQSGIIIAPKEESTTSYSVILAVENSDRIILHDPAGNSSFGEDDIDFEQAAQAKLFHLGYPPLLKRMYQDEGKELISIYHRAKKTGAVTSLDMSLPDAKSESGQVNWEAIMKKTLPNVDIFLPSVEEALFIFDREEYIKVTKLAHGDDFTKHIDMRKVMELGSKLISMGCAVVVIKCGSKGIYVKTANKQRFIKNGMCEASSLDKWADIEIFEESYIVNGFKSALAAGDTAIAGFLSAFIKGYGAIDCAKIAAKTGALCCTTYDALSGIVPLEDILANIKNHPEKMRYTELNTLFELDKELDTWFVKKS